MSSYTNYFFKSNSFKQHARPKSLSPAAAAVVVLLLIWVSSVAGNLVGGMAWSVVGSALLLDAVLPAPAVAEHGHETCRLVPIHPVPTFLNKRTELNITFQTSLDE
jgi:hypothetical protein